jgi:hypothetical protein
MLEQIGGRQLDSEQVAAARCRGADPGSLSMSYRYSYDLQKLAGTPRMELMHPSQKVIRAYVFLRIVRSGHNEVPLRWTPAYRCE